MGWCQPCGRHVPIKLLGSVLKDITEGEKVGALTMAHRSVVPTNLPLGPLMTCPIFWGSGRSVLERTLD